MSLRDLFQHLAVRLADLQTNRRTVLRRLAARGGLYVERLEPRTLLSGTPLFFDDFESGAGKWPIPGSMVLTDQVASTGKHSQTFTQVAAGGDARSTIFSVTPGQTYTLSVDYMTKGGGGFIGIDQFAAAGNQLEEEWLIGDGGYVAPAGHYQPGVWDYNIFHNDPADLKVWKTYTQSYTVPLNVAGIRIKTEDWNSGLPNDPVNAGVFFDNIKWFNPASPPPAITSVSGPSAGVRGQTLTFTAQIADAGPAATAVINWGDGTSTPVSITASNGAETAVGSHAFAGSGTYTVTITVTDAGQSAIATVPVSVSAAAVVPGCCDPNALVIGGTGGSDTIRVVPRGCGGAVKVLLNGQDVGTYAAGSFREIVVYGQAGDDDIEIAGGISAEACLFGGDGNDRLKAGAGNTVLEGGTGDDQLIGGRGHNLLIGGAGSDRLVGGGGDDILIGGATAFDANGAALCAIMDEWAHTGLSYRQRVDHLTGTPGGQNAPYYLNATTVSNDGAADTMTGSSGADLFFASLGDRVTGKKAGEVVVAV